MIKKNGVSRETINKLIKSKILIKSSEIVNRAQFEYSEELDMPKKLSEDQNNALKK